MIAEDFDAFFLKMMDVLHPYLDDLVVVGGTANALYRYHPLAAESPGAHPGTKDLDLATRRKLLEGDKPPLQKLLDNPDLEKSLHGDGAPPMMKFVSRKNPTLDLELLCPASGGRAEQAHLIQKGVSAQPLQYLALLLHHPWTLPLLRVPEFAESKLVVQIPTPYCYVMQKVLIRDQGRTAVKRAKDLFYIYEVASIFRNSLQELAKERKSVETEFAAKWSQRFRRSIAELFRDVNAPGTLDAANAGGVDRALIYGATSKLVEAFVAKG